MDGTGNNIPGDAANEPSLAVDPTAPNRMAIGWRQFDSISSNFRQAGYGWSVDGGRTWTTDVIDPGLFRSDPVLDADSQGNFYYSSLSAPGGAFQVDIFPSTDAGRTWEAGVPAFGGDKQWMIVDRTGTASDGHIYMSWSSFAGCCGADTFTRSTDGGQSYSTPVSVQPLFGTLATAADGTLYVGGVSPFDFTDFRVARSTNAKDPNVTPTFDQTVSVDLGGALAFSEGPNPGGLLGQVWIQVDPCTDDVYLLASVQPLSGPDPMELRFSRSTDGGATWSPSVRINDDAPAAGSWQWFGTLSVSPDGRLDVVWNDTRAAGQADLSELYYASSDDGGQSWSSNQALSGTWDSFLGFPSQSKIGDYYELSSDRVGAHLAWAATFNGEQDVYYTRIGDYDCNGNGVGDSADLVAGTSSDENSDGIPDECQCFASNYCTAAVNSSGAEAMISASGSLSLADNALTLTAAQAPANQPGLFFYGQGRAQVPFGNGVRCVSGSGGLFRLSPPVFTDGQGMAARSLDFGAPPLNAGPGQIAAFSTWNFQFWFRDPAAGGAGFNLSNGLELTLCP